MRRNAEIGGALDDLLGNGEANVRVLGNAGVVVRDGDHGHVVLLDQRQDAFEPFFLAGDGIEQRTSLGGLQTGLECAGNGGVDAQRNIGDGLHHLDELRHQHRLDEVVVGIARVRCHLAGEHRARIDVEHGGAGLDLRNRIAWTLEKSPRSSSSFKILRPVGLMRSPITQKGRSKPMTTSLVAEATIVWVM